MRKSAERGNPDACFQLGTLYEAGRVVETDMVQALHWFRMASDHGHPMAQYQLGMMFLEGRGAPQNFHQAAALLTRAAEKKHAVAQYYLATLYHSGQGVPEDVQQAYVWSSLAVACGCRLAEAEALRDQLAKQLPAMQLREAQRESSLFFEQWQLQLER